MNIHRHTKTLITKTIIIAKIWKKVNIYQPDEQKNKLQYMY